jgi:hypothetical protein
MLKERQKRIRVAIMAIGVITTLCFIIVPGFGRRMLRRDYADALPQQGVATLALIVEERVEAGTDKRYPPKVIVRFREAVHRVRNVTPEDITGMKVNQQVRITYRVGKSGRVYVDSIAPLPASENLVSKRIQK